MPKDPAFLFYSSDFLTGVADLTMEERGQFITLLCLQHQKGHLTQKVMRLQCGGIPNADVLAKFRTDENGLYYNERIEQERERRAAHSIKQRENALKRWKKDKTLIKQTISDGNAMAMPLETETETETVTETKTKTEVFPAFSDFWDLYDKKRGPMDKIKIKWKRLPQKTKEEIIDYLPDYIKSTPDKNYRKDPQTFLNQESWKDEIIIKNSNYGTAQKNGADRSSFKEKIVAKLQSS